MPHWRPHTHTRTSSARLGRTTTRRGACVKINIRTELWHRASSAVERECANALGRRRRRIRSGALARCSLISGRGAWIGWGVWRGGATVAHVCVCTMRPEAPQVRLSLNVYAGRNVRARACVSRAWICARAFRVCICKQICINKALCSNGGGALMY